ncbi:MAG: antirestriction protein ArdA [Ralstonia sp.]|uniref:antirestriction protein ArdA n=1 Tax=Ralstonia sp. TaxID=54061 RepID=UPI00257E8356|nr:antirestriction protein ArdA [Ralstonia sp.]MBA4233751.1 antirestriction protein ArdA [Ralstonia sp.]
MTTTLYAQPYDISATGFYFDDADSYARQADALRNDYGQPVEEFEIQFIDGERIDAALAEAWGLNQTNLARFFEIVDDWLDDQKQRFIIAVAECGHDFDPASVDPDEFDLDLHEVDTLRDLAEQFIDDGFFGEIPRHLANYIDYDAIARDLAVDFSETVIAGRRLIYAFR